MTKINVKISWSGDNYTATSADINGVVVTTNKDYKLLLEEFKELFDFHIEGSIEDNDSIPEYIKNGNFEFKFDLTTSALLHKYDGILSRAALARITGINEKQIGHYASCHRTPRPATRKKIIDGLHKLGNELISV